MYQIKSFWKIFGQCISCFSSSRSFPLCENCERALILCPPLCPDCGGHLCLLNASEHDGILEKTCLRPWRKNESIHSYSAQYLLTSQCYGVLKSWKNHQGLILNQKVLKLSPELLKIWVTFEPDLILPVPQSFHRSWQLRGNPAENIAKTLSIPLSKALGRAIPLLNLINIQKKLNRQSSFNLQNRYEKRIEIKINPRIQKFKKILLIDDFRTTGKTTQHIAQTINPTGAIQVHIFHLGIRPQFIEKK